MGQAQQARMEAYALAEQAKAEWAPSLRDLAANYIQANAALNNPACPDADYSRRADAYWDAKEALQGGFDKRGLDAAMRDSLGMFL